MVRWQISYHPGISSVLPATAASHPSGNVGETSDTAEITAQVPGMRISERLEDELQRATNELANLDRLLAAHNQTAYV